MHNIQAAAEMPWHDPSGLRENAKTDSDEEKSVLVALENSQQGIGVLLIAPPLNRMPISELEVIATLGLVDSPIRNRPGG